MVTKEFNPQQIQVAKELRTIFQAKRLEMLKKGHKLAFNFNHVTKATMLDVETYNEWIDRFEALEVKVESLETEQQYGHRQDLDDAPEQWTSKPKGISLAEWYAHHQETSR